MYFYTWWIWDHDGNETDTNQWSSDADDDDDVDVDVDNNNSNNIANIIRIRIRILSRYAVRLYALQLDSIRFVSSNSDFFHMNNRQETNNNNNFMKCCDLIPMKLDEFVFIFASYSLCFFFGVCVCLYIRQWFWDGHLFLPLRPYLFYPSPPSIHLFQLNLIFHLHGLYGSICVCSID